VKFTPEAGHVVMRGKAVKDCLLLGFADTGIGIAPDAQARIFQEFEQADGGSTRRHGGTGLGLSISQRIVERMGGRIKVGSAPQVGSTFRFTIALPAAESQIAPVRPRLDGATLLIVAPAQKTIAASLLARRLAVWGARSCVVANAATALARLDGQEWDAVMVDRAIGPQAAEAIARAAARASARRIVLVTPGDRGELANLKAAGFTGYLVKPVRAASLAARFGVEDSDFETQSDAAAPGPEPEKLARGGGLAILVAEDNEINALLARALLTRLGHRPALARNGAQAVDSWLAARAAGEPYDLVLMDVHMPEVDGIAATRRIRDAEATAGGARTPIVALTANAFSDDRDACLAAGMDAFLTKPLDRERLAELLATGRATIAA